MRENVAAGSHTAAQKLVRRWLTRTHSKGREMSCWAGFEQSLRRRLARTVSGIRQLLRDKLPANCVCFDEDVRKVSAKPSLLMQAEERVTWLSCDSVSDVRAL